MTPDDAPEIRLPAERDAVIELIDAGGEPEVLRLVVARYPHSSLAWAKLAEAVFGPGSPVESFAYASVGRQRGLEALRAAGWGGERPLPSVPWSHEPNRGVLRSLYALARAAAEIGDGKSAEAAAGMLAEADPTAATEIEAARTAPIPVQNPAPPTETIIVRGED